MSLPEAWFEAARSLAMQAWRGVDTQYLPATMRLVDSLEEQAVLEALLEKSKPPQPPESRALDPLLAAPFRYRPRHGSRFRRPDARGVWYGADSVRTACAEVAYWRWRFITDSSGLTGGELLSEHLLFRAGVAGRSLDLTAPPWSERRAAWTHASDYSATQVLADAARGHAVEWLRYESVRDASGVCAAVLEPTALGDVEPASLQTWHCRTTATAVRLVPATGLAPGHEWRFGSDAPGN